MHVSQVMICLIGRKKKHVGSDWSTSVAGALYATVKLKMALHDWFRLKMLHAHVDNVMQNFH